MKPLPLWRKELIELRPWGLLSVLLGVMDPLSDLAKHVDMMPMSSRFAYVIGSGLIPSWMLAFAVGMGVAVRERDDGTLGFLDGLPVRRVTIFFTRVVVAVALVSLAPVVRASASVVMHLLSRGSLDHALHVGLVLEGLGLALLLMLSGVLTGAAIGGLRSLAWLAAGALGVGLNLLIDRVPRAAMLNPLALCEVTAGSRGLRVDPDLVWTQAGLCVISAFIAWRVFDGGGGVRLLTLSRRPVVGALIATLTIVVGVVMMSQLKSDKSDSDKDKKSGPRFEPGPPAQTQTAHYRFSYPSHRSQPVLALAKQADAIFERVHALLHLSPGERIDVDASGSQRNTAGTAFSNGLRLDPDADADLTPVLAHETTHVVAHRLTGADTSRLWEKAVVLNEGLATWVERHFETNSPEREEGRLVLAALQRRHELSVNAFADLQVLAERDALLKYPAGETVIEAIVEVAGDEALPRLLNGFADQQLPQDLEGLELWRVVFQNAGVDLSMVLDAVARSLANEGRTRAAVLTALPRPRARLVKSNGRVGAQVLLDTPLPAGWGLALRFKPAPTSPSSRFERVAVTRDEIVWRSNSTIKAGRVCVQAGVTAPRSHLALFEPWSCEMTSAAEALPDVTDAVMVLLASVQPQAVFDRPAHVDHPQGDFGSEVGDVWGPLTALDTEWNLLPENEHCLETMEKGTVKALDEACHDVLTRALGPAETVARAVRAERAGPAGILHWTRRSSEGEVPGGPWMAASALMYDGALRLERDEVVAAGARCLEVLALARDLEWGGDGPIARQALSIEVVVMPLCLRVAAREPALLRDDVARVTAGLAPTAHVLEQERLRASALDFGALVSDVKREALPPEVRNFLAKRSETNEGENEGDEAEPDQWNLREAAWRNILAAPDDVHALEIASKQFANSSAQVRSVLSAHACRAGLLAMLSGAKSAALTTSTASDGAVTAEVHCGVDEPFYTATTRGREVGWLVSQPH